MCGRLAVVDCVGRLQAGSAPLCHRCYFGARLPLFDCLFVREKLFLLTLGLQLQLRASISLRDLVRRTDQTCGHDWRSEWISEVKGYGAAAAAIGACRSRSSREVVADRRSERLLPNQRWGSI